MGDIYRTITLGIGGSSDITGLILMGLNTPLYTYGDPNRDLIEINDENRLCLVTSEENRFIVPNESRLITVTKYKTL